jgi:hypothetical protein
VHDGSQRPASAYALRSDGVDLGLALVRRGFARVSYTQPFELLRSYRAAEAAAEVESRGLWSHRCSDLSVALTATPTPVTVGNSVSFGLSVANHRPFATPATLTVRLSAPATVTTDDPARRTASTSVICSFDLDPGFSLAPAARAIPAPLRGTRTLYFAVAPRSPGELRVVAVVGAPNADLRRRTTQPRRRSRCGQGHRSPTSR